MGIIAFLFRAALRLTVWVLALVGALVVAGGLLWVFVIWPGVESAYPDHARAMQYAESEVNRILGSAEPGPPDCDTSLDRLNALAEMRTPAAFIAAEELNRTRRCGGIEGGDVLRGLSMISYAPPLTFGERTSGYFNELVHWSGLSYRSDFFWYGHPETRECFSEEVFDLSGWQAWRSDNADYREIRMAQIQKSYQCGQILSALGHDYLNDSDIQIRANAAWLISRAGSYHNPDARWWYEFVFPTLDQERFGYFAEEAEPYRFSGPCSELMRNPTDADQNGRSLREMAAMGQAEATELWLSYGPFETDEPFRSCMEEEYPDLFRHSQAWNGGYDTPFWYAVHAIRTEHEAGLSSLPEIEADIGADCIGLAGEIAVGLRPIIPGPPVDDPELRTLILSSLTCQPDGLRDPAEYWNEHYSMPDSAGYLPPEAVYVLPSFEPIFRRVEADTIEN